MNDVSTVIPVLIPAVGPAEASFQRDDAQDFAGVKRDEVGMLENHSHV